MDVSAAVEGQVLELAPSQEKGSARRAGESQAQMPIELALANSSVLLGIADTKMATAFSSFIQAEGIHVEFFSDMDEARKPIPKDARRWWYLSTIASYRRDDSAAQSASKVTVTTINFLWSWSPHKKFRRPAPRRTSRTG